MIWMYVIVKDNASETQKQKQKLIGSSSVTVRPFTVTDKNVLMSKTHTYMWVSVFLYNTNFI